MTTRQHTDTTDAFAAWLTEAYGIDAQAAQDAAWDFCRGQDGATLADLQDAWADAPHERRQ